MTKDTVAPERPLPQPSFLRATLPWERGIRGLLRRWLRIPDTGPIPRYEIARLDLKPGNILVVKLSTHEPQERMRQMTAYIKPCVPPGVKVWIIDKGLTTSKWCSNDHRTKR
jgi:hypothetical protein